jgi:hypothetical protein
VPRKNSRDLRDFIGPVPKTSTVSQLRRGKICRPTAFL